MFSADVADRQGLLHPTPARPANTVVGSLYVLRASLRHPHHSARPHIYLPAERPDEPAFADEVLRHHGRAGAV
jgi:hypothetical protein